MKRRNRTSVGGTVSTDFQKDIQSTQVKGITLRENDLIQSNNDIKIPNKPSERAKNE